MPKRVRLFRRVANMQLGWVVLFVGLAIGLYIYAQLVGSGGPPKHSAYTVVTISTTRAELARQHAAERRGWAIL